MVASGRPSQNAGMSNPTELLRQSHTILLIDWPSRDVPDALVLAGHSVVSHDGPDEDDYNIYEPGEDGVRVRGLGRAPARADLVYAHRPITELDGIVAQAASLGARAVWLQSGQDESGNRDPRGTWLDQEEADLARSIVEAAGLEYLDSPYIGDATATSS